MKKYLLLLTAIGLFVAIPVSGQNSSLWKFVGNLRPVVSTWRIDATGGLRLEDLPNCNLGTDVDGDVECVSAGGNFGSGNVVAIGDPRYVNTAGDTMTGNLLVRATISGSSLRIDDLKSCNTIDTDVNGVLVCGTDEGGGGSTYTAGQGLTLLGSSFKVNATLTGSLVRFATVSGSLVKASTTLSSSGTLVFEGAASGSSLYLGTSLEGAGLSTCSGGNKLLWSAGRFSCAADVDTNTTYTAGKGLTLNGTSFSTNNVMTGSLASFTTVSGSIILAKNTLSSSGSLTWEGSASGATLYVATSINGAGLVDCDIAGTSKLLWDATAGRFSCGTDTDTNTTYTAGQGLQLSGTSFRLLSAFSGSVISASTTLASSGSLVWEGAATGATLVVSGQFSGAGLTDCDLTTQTLGWDAGTNRFTCGTDSDTTYTAGKGLTLAGTSFSTNDILTGSLIRFTTLSGSLVYAKNAIASSGSLTWEGAASGATLYLGGKLEGVGLIDCDTGASSKLLWDATTGRFSCGTDQTGAGLPAGGSSGQLVVNQEPGSAIWRYEKEFERFTVYGANTRIRRGSGANLLTAFSGSIIGAQVLQRSAMSGVTVHLYVNNQRIFSTPLTTDNREVASTTAATPAVIDATKNRFNKYDTLRFDVSGTGAVAGTGLNLLIFYNVHAW